MCFPFLSAPPAHLPTHPGDWLEHSSADQLPWACWWGRGTGGTQVFVKFPIPWLGEPEAGGGQVAVVVGL